MKDRKKELYINFSKETHIDYMLSAFLTRQTYPWFCENYINIGMPIGEGVGLIEFIDILIPHGEIYTEHTIIHTFDEIKSRDNFFDIIVDLIDREYYSGVWVDEYYIQGSAHFNSSHFIHPIFIYSYDAGERIFKFLHFNPLKGMIKLDSDWDIVRQAFFSIEYYLDNGGNQNILYYPLVGYKREIHNTSYKFNINNFSRKLHDYLFSTYISKDIISGMAVYEHLLKCLNDGNSYIPLRSITTLLTQKEYLVDRFKYIESLYQTTDQYSNLIQKYQTDIVRSIENIKFLNLKYVVSDKENIYQISQNQEFIEKLKSTINRMRFIEQEILIKIYCELKKITGIESQYKAEKLVPQSVYKMDELKWKFVLQSEEKLYGLRIVEEGEHYHYTPISKITFDDNEEFILQDNAFLNHSYRELLLSSKKIQFFIFEDLYGDRTSIENISFIAYKGFEKKYWQEQSLYEWAAKNNITDINYSDVIKGHFYSKNPFLQCQNVNVDAEKAKFIYIVFKVTSNSESAQIYFTSSYSGDVDLDTIKTVAINPDNEYHKYIIDMSDNQKWKGLIKTLRFDPVHFNNKDEGDFMIKSIEVSDKCPVYSNIQDFTGVQGVNGWFYYSYDNGITYKELSYIDGKWMQKNNQDLVINSNSQSSANQFTSVLRWICPASGKYNISCKITQMTMGQYTSYCIKKNFSEILGELPLGVLCGGNDFSATEEVLLNIGDYISFEYYNQDELTVEQISVDINIEKIK